MAEEVLTDKQLLKLKVIDRLRIHEGKFVYMIDPVDPEVPLGAFAEVCKAIGLSEDYKMPFIYED